MWWHIYARQWNGVSLLWQTASDHPRGTRGIRRLRAWGCGAYRDAKWFQLQWPPSLQAASMQVKELIPLVVAAWLFGSSWAGKVIQFEVDNKAVVDILKSTYSRENHLCRENHLMQSITSGSLPLTFQAE